MRRTAKVDANHREIVDALRRIGAGVQSLAGVGNGVPDLLVYFRGEDRSYGSCAAAAYAAYAAYTDELARQVQDMRDVIAKRARKDGEYDCMGL